jgi:acyl-CoA dehydrogenase
VRRIRTHGVRAAHVGEFEVAGHELPRTDVIARGRAAWDAVLGAVTLGKFFLGFGSIGICEHAFREARDHLRTRILYGRPAIDMPHLRATMGQAYARLTAMKLYAYRALDYVHAAAADDRRYLLFAAVQKARVSAEGVRVVDSLSECVGAKAFEADTYLEMALRDARLFPGLEGSAHINLVLTTQFVPRYFGDAAGDVSSPASLVAGEAAPAENPYLTQARSGGVNAVAFPHYLRAYVALLGTPNVRRFAKQARAFRRALRGRGFTSSHVNDTQFALALGHCVATIAYGQLVAEHACRLEVEPQMVSGIFHLLVADLSAAALALAAMPRLDATDRARLHRMVSVPLTPQSDWDWVCDRMGGS